MKIYGVTGWKNNGKTGLMERLVAEFCARGFSVSTLKHAHHTTDVDQSGTDSYRHRSAGAQEVVLASPNRVAIMQELRGADEPTLTELLARLRPVDLVLIEGFKREAHPKIEAHRAAAGQALLAPQNTTIRGIASDSPDAPALTRAKVPVFDLDDTMAIADFITSDIGLHHRQL